MSKYTEIEQVAAIVPQLYDAADEEALINKCLKTSYDARKKMNSADVCSSLVYGEMLLSTLQTVFNHIDVKKGDVFIDVGAGSGKVVLAASLMFEFGLCRGVELMAVLHAISEKALSKLRSDFPDKMRADNVQFDHIDATEADWSNANVVYLCSTCFSDSLLDAITRKCEELQNGATVITLSYNLPSTLYEVEHVLECDMSWGFSTIYIQRKVHSRPEATNIMRHYLRHAGASMTI